MILFLVVVTLVAVYFHGVNNGEKKERERHERAVKEAQNNITSITDHRR